MDMSNELVSALGINGVTLPRTCIICKNDKFVTHPHYATLILMDDEKDAKLNEGVMVSCLSCDKCGHITLFNAGVLGLRGKIEK